jgi:hypothetical protein
MLSLSDFKHVTPVEDSAILKFAKYHQTKYPISVVTLIWSIAEHQRCRYCTVHNSRGHNEYTSIACSTHPRLNALSFRVLLHPGMPCQEVSACLIPTLCEPSSGAERC